MSFYSTTSAPVHRDANSQCSYVQKSLDSKTLTFHPNYYFNDILPALVELRKRFMSVSSHDFKFADKLQSQNFLNHD